jgi:two-component system NtrC family sensor kinase
MPPEKDRTRGYSSLSRKIFNLAHRYLQRPEFFEELSGLLVEFARCDAAAIYVREQGRTFCSRIDRGGEGFEYEALEQASTELGGGVPRDCGEAPLDAVCRDLLAGLVVSAGPRFTRRGALVGSFGEQLSLEGAGVRAGSAVRYELSRDAMGGHYALVPIALDEADLGLLALRRRRGDFTQGDVELLERTAPVVGITIIHHRTQLAVRERVKELTCLYNISRLVGQAETSLPEIVCAVVELLPPAWLYSDITRARVVLDGQVYTLGFEEGHTGLSAPLVIDGAERGFVEVAYTEPRPELDEGPFLKEERSLIDVVAKELSIAVQQREAQQERLQLRDQLRHADRLATIGQLAAGVAHELNEPVGNILGFAQLALKAADVPEPVLRDLDKIVTASLHAREIVKKLMIFARQSPPRTAWFDLNAMVEDGLYFLEARCAKAGIELVRRLDPDLPEISADTGQLYQVLMNLAVNAIQAMSEGGRLVISTHCAEEVVQLSVQDTGVGIDPAVIERIFMPFFTTKDVGEGTGLGLAVAEGIAQSHGGTITVASSPGDGSTFTLSLPRRGPPAAVADPEG